MGLLRIMLPPKLQLLAVLVFGVAVLFLENQIQKLEESRGKLGERRRGAAGGRGRNAGPGAAGRPVGAGRGEAGRQQRGPAGRRRERLGVPGQGGTRVAGCLPPVAPRVYLPETIEEPINMVWGLRGRGCQQQRRQPWPLSSFVCVFRQPVRPRRGGCWKDKYFCRVSRWVFLKEQRCSEQLEQRLACLCLLTGAWERGREAVAVPKVSLVLLPAAAENYHLLRI